MCHVSRVMCNMSCLFCLNIVLKLVVEGLLSTGPTPSSCLPFPFLKTQQRRSYKYKQKLKSFGKFLNFFSSIKLLFFWLSHNFDFMTHFNPNMMNDMKMLENEIPNHPLKIVTCLGFDFGSSFCK